MGKPKVVESYSFIQEAFLAHRHDLGCDDQAAATLVLAEVLSELANSSNVTDLVHAVLDAIEDRRDS